MAFKTEPIEVMKVKDKVVDPRDKKTLPKENGYYQWWLAEDEKSLCSQLLSTTEFLKKVESARIRQASIYTRLFSGKPLYNYLASTSTLDNSQQMPMGRPTSNIVYSCVDTLTSMITEDEPSPKFLTDGGSYKEQRLGKEMNKFIGGEFYRMQAHQKGAMVFRDSCTLGSGLGKCVKRMEKVNGKKFGFVDLERTLITEVLVDFNDGYYDNPRSIIHTKLCDRGILADQMPDESGKIYSSQGGTVDSSPQSTDTVSDQIIVAEGWHLPSGRYAKDGRHVIVCSEGVLLDEPWTKQRFPFPKLDYNKNTVSWYSQGLAEILFPTQMEIYKCLILASQSLELTAVPKIIISDLSKVLETAFNNNISSIIKVKNMAEAPQFINPTANNPELYKYIDWLIKNGFSMAGISELNASSEKPAGLNSGEAQRVHQDIQSRRFAALQRRYQNWYTDLAYMNIDFAKDIAEETGKYESVYPGRDGTRSVELPKAGMLKDTAVIKCYEESSLPKDPAGRQAKLSEMLAAGEISNDEFRSLSRFEDLEQSDQLASALRERILHDLDQIVEDGQKGYVPPDEFILDPTDLATTLTVQTINKYSVTDLEDEKMQLLYDYFTQVQMLKQKAMPPPMPMPQQAGPLPVAPPNPSQGPTSGAQV
jgi:hypothetical protein